jgi:hypothetical protein
MPDCGPVIGNRAPPRGVSPGVRKVPAPSGSGEETGLSGRPGTAGMRRSTSPKAGFGAVGTTSLDGFAGTEAAGRTGISWPPEPGI